MSNLKRHALTASCALLGSTGLAGIAAAQTAPTTIYGGGASATAPYWRQAGDCYGQSVTLYSKGSPPTIIPISAVSGVTCTPGSNTVQYVSLGSGMGVGALYSHDANLFGDNGSGTPLFPTVHYALSAIDLTQTDLATYNQGGTEQGLGFGPGEYYPTPAPLYGPLVQFPISVNPVALAYSAVYKKIRNADGTITAYHFNVQSPNSDGSGGLKLDAATYCKIFTGQITNWNDPALTALNGGVLLQDPNDTGTFSVPLQIVGRMESSGETSILTRHLAAVCDSSTYVTGTSNLPAAVSGATYQKTQPNTAPAGETLGKFTLANGDDGVAKYLNFPAVPATTAGSTVIQGRFGYLSPSYALPAVTKTGVNIYGLNVADLKNSSGVFEEPTGVKALSAFGSSSPPTGSSVSDPTAWVQSTAPTAPLANPTAPRAYPIVGTTNFLGYTCYANSNTLTVLQQFLNFGSGSNAAIILSNAGLSQLPTAWLTAIGQEFVAPTSTTHTNNLFFALAGTGLDGLGDGYVNSNCTASGVVGG